MLDRKKITIRHQNVVLIAQQILNTPAPMFDMFAISWIQKAQGRRNLWNFCAHVNPFEILLVWTLDSGAEASKRWKFEIYQLSYELFVI